ncbi:MAG: Ig-like domain-containing protein [Gemmatimonadota bacterium]
MKLKSLSLAMYVAVAACGDSTGPDVRVLSIEPDVGLAVGTGGTMQFEAIALGEGGVELSSAEVRWSVDDPSIASIDANGRATGVSEGFTMVTAELGDRSATAGLEVYEPPAVGTFVPGQSYFGREDYIEYIPGTLPVVLSAGHGGSETPAEIADRTFGVVIADRNTLELTLAVRDALIDLTGQAPHVVLSRLHRSKLDPNREIEEAAQGNPFAERAWAEYHGYIDHARTVASARGEGMYFDMHGHGHAVARLELGYLLTGSQLDGTDASLNGIPVVRQTSIRELGRDTPLDFSSLLRGPTSFGGFLEGEGVPVVPSPGDPSPNGAPYFSGGYSTREHGSLNDGELVSGIQIEHHYPGLRDTDANRRDYAERLARVIRDYMLEHIGYFEP